MITELIRLLVTLAATAIGYTLGERQGGGEASNVTGAMIGAGVGYVIGGVVGRSRVRALAATSRYVDSHWRGPQLFAGAFGLFLGLLLGGLLAIPLWVFLPKLVSLPLGALVMTVGAVFGGRLFAARAADLFVAAGMQPRSLLVTESLDSAAKTFVIDSSAAIDGRVLQLARAGLLSGRLCAPLFVIDELQAMADAGDPTRRRRGRRGLEVLEALREVPGVDFRILEDQLPEFEEVDAKLAALTARAGATLVTTDHNLAKVAAVRGLAILNPHALGEALRPEAIVGEVVSIRLEKAGSEPGQAVGYMEDGTMVVVEGTAARIGHTMEVTISHAVRTQIGRLLFARPAA